MWFHSTRGGAVPVGAAAAIRAGMAADGGLFVPETLPALAPEALAPDLPFPDRAASVLRPFFAGDPAAPDLDALCRAAFTFPVPLRWRGEEGQAMLELFHGPTLAFKDIGARFLAEFLDAAERAAGPGTLAPGDPGRPEAARTFAGSGVAGPDDRGAPCHGPGSPAAAGPASPLPLHVLVATSGDTGGAVAAAFAGRATARVSVLFPAAGVSERQRAQLTCWGGNVTAYAVAGTFDDCQRLVKAAFAVPGQAQRLRLTSANSINLGRLLPQVTYYVEAAARFAARLGEPPLVVVPTGNVGNVTAAFWAKAMGAPLGEIVLAVNANRVLPDFLATGEFRPRPSLATLANAMDVGNPSNWERVRTLFGGDDKICQQVQAYSVTDDEIRQTIREVFAATGEILCPHTAVAERVRRTRFPGRPAIVVATAHPAKFETIVEPLIGRALPVPPALADLLARPRREHPLDPSSPPPWEELAGPAGR
ncbi:MAG: threonine synthase [Candidatus Riflebacteria bacterium]|nr:threonine synthase [Candidatus Riflebacteria bacterium]